MNQVVVEVIGLYSLQLENSGYFQTLRISVPRRQTDPFLHLLQPPSLRYFFAVANFRVRQLARHSVADEVAGRRLRRRGHVPRQKRTTPCEICWARRQASMSRRLSRKGSCAKD